MKIEVASVISTGASTQPAVATLAESNVSRTDIVITVTAMAGGPYYIKRGADASPTNFCYKVTTAGQVIILENYRGKITVSPAATAGDFNVSEGLDHL